MSTTMKLPSGQRRILEFFAQCEDDGVQASRAEVAQALGYAFPSAVSKHVEALQRKGLMQADRRKKRNVRISETGWQALGRTPRTKGIPVIGSIAAGVPILASENHAGYLEDLTPGPNRFALQVRGDSMVEAGILDGDFAVIDAENEVREGGIGAVMLDGSATLKRVRREVPNVILEPANANYRPTIVTPELATDGFHVIGPLVFVYRQVD